MGQRDSSETLVRQALQQTAGSSPKAKVEALLGMAEHLQDFMQTDSAILFAKQALQLAEQHGLELEKAKALRLNGFLEFRKIHLAPAMEYCENAIAIAKRLQDTLLETKCLTCLTSALRTYYNSSEYHQPAIDFEHALTVFEKYRDTSSVIGALLTLVDMYRIDPEKHGDKVNTYFSRAGSLLKEYRHDLLMVKYLNLNASLLDAADQTEAAFQELKKAMRLSKQLQLPWMTQHLYLGFYDYYSNKKDYIKALESLDSAEAAYPDFLFGEATRRYADTYAAMGNHEAAYVQMQRTLYLVDSLIRDRQEKMTAESGIRYKTKEKELALVEKQAELKEQQFQNRMLMGGAIFLVLLSFAAFFAFTVQRQARKALREKNKVIEQQAKELRQLDELKSRFFANVSHELRTPLTLMLGPVNSLLKTNHKNRDEVMLLQFIQRNARKLHKLINEILDLSKLENNKMVVEEEPVLFYPYLKEQMAQFHSFAASNEVDFELKFEADQALEIMLDKNKFEKIIHNFLSNALKFTPPKGQVNLAVATIDADLQIKVSDTGRGIHPNDLPHIFDRYYQSRQPDAKTEGGTGIGLSLCLELAELLGGKVWAESGLGKGSIFYFQFPRQEATLEVTSLRESRQIEQEGVTSLPAPVSEQMMTPSRLPTNPTHKDVTTGGTILIVEDNPDLRQYLQFLLSEYQIITAENGKDALDQLKNTDTQNSKPKTQNFPDLIISDLMMPVMDGLQLLERLKSDDRWRHLPTLMLTAKVNARVKLKALRIGVDDYLTKPFQEEELKARIENMLHNYRERMEHFSANGNESSNYGSSTSPKPVMAQVDADWLEEAEKAFTKILNDSSLNFDWIATQLHISQRQLQRRLQQLTGLSPTKYLHEMRMSKAYDLLVEGRYSTVKEVSYAVGIRDTKYFSKRFQERFGVSPSSLR